MMTLTEFDARIREAATVRREGERLMKDSWDMEERAIDAAGIKWHSREPGFPGWCMPSVSGEYFNTPREALVAAEKARVG
jgi:hypothetical protein